MATWTILLLYWKMLGLCPFNIAEDGSILFSYTGAIYGLILTVFYSYYYILAVTSQMTFVLPRKTPLTIISNFSGLSIEYASLVLVWSYLGHRRKRLQSMLKCLNDINESFADHGMRTDDTKFVRDVKIQTLILNIVWYLICVIAYQLFLHFEPFKLSVWMPIMIPRGVNHNGVLIFVTALRLIKERFRMLNETIGCLSNGETRRINVFPKNLGQRTRNDGLQSLETAVPLETYGKLHANLVDFTNVVVEFFSLFILFAILLQIFQMVGTFYTLCVIVSTKSLRPWAFVWIYWVAIHVVELIIMVLVCDSTVKEANRTGSVLHGMLTAGCTDEHLDSARVLSLRLLQKQLRIDVYGLFEMKHVIINKITGMVIVYITIMIQLDVQSDAKI